MAVLKDDITVVLPTLNEEEAIGKVLDEIEGEGYENVLVVDGHSKDKTVDIARERGAKVVYQRGEGKARAVEKAIKEALTPYILIMDGDWTYPAGDIQKLMGKAEDHSHVIGSRRNKGNIPLLHRLGNWGITLVFNTLMRTDFEDVLSGMYLLETSRASELEFPLPGFECEVTICAQLADETAEVPIGYRKRKGEVVLSGLKGLTEILYAAISLSRKYGNPTAARLIVSVILSVLGVGGAVLLTSLGKLLSAVGKG